MDASKAFGIAALILGLLGSVANGYAASPQLCASRQLWRKRLVLWEDRVATVWSFVGVDLIGLAAVAGIELLIDCEEDRTLRAVLVGMLREAG